MKLNESDYYDGTKAVSYNCPITMVCGERSLGKTYWFKRRAIRRALDHGCTHIYMRRYDEQVKSLLRKRNNYFLDIVANDEFPGWEFRTNSRIMEYRRPEWKSWKTLGYFMALSTYENEKSGFDPHTDTIIYDEFIKENKRIPYITNEPSALYNLWETIDRREDRVKLYLLGNAADLVNPFFLEWRVTLSEDTPRYTRWHDNMVLLDYARSTEAFAERSQQSMIGRVTAKSSYDSYARQNQFADLNDDFIRKTKPGNAIHICTFAYQNDVLGVWLDASQGEYQIMSGAPSDGKPVYTITRADMRPNLIMLRRSEPMLKTMSRMYRAGFIFFDRVRTRERFLDMLTRAGQL